MNRQSFIGRIFLFILFTVSTLLSADDMADIFGGPTERYSYIYGGNNIGEIRSGTIRSVEYYGSFIDWGVGGGHYVTDNISIEVIMEAFGEEFERDGVILPGTYNNVISVTSVGLSAAALYHYTNNPWHLHLGVGAGYFNTDILITHPDDGKFTDEGTPTSRCSIGYHASLGVDYEILEHLWLGMEFKKRKLYADFGQYTGGKVDVGGDYLLFVVSFLF